MAGIRRALTILTALVLCVSVFTTVALFGGWIIVKKGKEEKQ